MQLRHIALVCSSENNSDKFYKGLLGLEKKKSKILPKALCKKLFNQDTEYKIINYMGNGLHFEIFLGKHDQEDKTRIEHVCLEVDDLSQFLNSCHAMGSHTVEIPKEDNVIIFVEDFDGNRFG